MNKTAFLGDTIVAIITPQGSGAIGVIRLSGPDAIDIAAHYVRTRPSLKRIADRTATFARVEDNGHLLDEALVTVFHSPGSYTGEDVVELSCHGNPFLLQQVVALFLRHARAAGPGEFTQRAFLNDRMDLTRAEAVGDLLAARTRHMLDAAAEQLEGRLLHRIVGLLDRLTQRRIQLELEIDFVEQDTPALDHAVLASQLRSLADDLAGLSATGEEGMILRDGLRVVLVGPPNVGKSSIFNAFLQTERAIVTPEPGTTRDWLEEAVALDGYLVRLFDTAGLRRPADAAERAGIERSRQIVEQAHSVLLVSDGEEVTPPEYVAPERVIRVLNKTDSLPPETVAEFGDKGWVPCSAVAPGGLDALKHRLLADIVVDDDELRSGLLTNARQVAAVHKACVALDKALRSFDEGLGYEFTAFDLKEASHALEEVTGHVTTDDILRQIFTNYCIGK
ncbi:MAG: tRNA uridine-5-carboxymethylaminomethyl(34) synthesis GTPase MnmE [Candidatus Cloacimonetes bacterium]|nr:tRNA uridine-5-carboxymethylaminomethyl(34) synthesis GTPase MnmE [Candidatus Cloacimonadota bacterium]